MMINFEEFLFTDNSSFGYFIRLFNLIQIFVALKSKLINDFENFVCLTRN
jgi:hypothetical protein